MKTTRALAAILVLPVCTSLPAIALEEHGEASASDTSYVEVLERALRPADIAVTFTINDRPIRYNSSAQEMKSAEELAEKALKIARENAAENTRSLCSALDCAGIVYYRSGDYARSWACLEESLALKKSGGSNRELAATCDLLAMVGRARLKYENAENLYKEANQLKETEFGGSSVETAKGFVNLSNLYFDSGAADKARQVQSRAVEIVAANNAVGKDIAIVLAPASLMSSPGSVSLPGVNGMAGAIISAQQLADAEKKAEQDALTAMRTGVAPQRPVNKSVVIRGRHSYYEHDNGDDEDRDLERKRLEVAKQLIEAQESARKANEEKTKRDAEERAVLMRREAEDSARRAADEAIRRAEAQQNQLQRQREAAGDGTSYFSRY